MCAESGITGGDGNLVVAKDPKILRFDNFLIGCAGIARTGQTLEMHMIEPKVGPDPYITVARSLVNSIKKCLKAQDEELTSHDEFLVAHKGRLFSLDGKGYTFYPALNYWAVGVGADMALAVMYATKDSRRPPEWRLRRAVETACYFKDSCIEPIKLEVL